MRFLGRGAPMNYNKQTVDIRKSMKWLVYTWKKIQKEKNKLKKKKLDTEFKKRIKNIASRIDSIIKQFEKNVYKLNYNATLLNVNGVKGFINTNGNHFVISQNQRPPISQMRRILNILSKTNVNGVTKTMNNLKNQVNMGTQANAPVNAVTQTGMNTGKQANAPVNTGKQANAPVNTGKQANVSPTPTSNFQKKLIEGRKRLKKANQQGINNKSYINFTKSLNSNYRRIVTDDNSCEQLEKFLKFLTEKKNKRKNRPGYEFEIYLIDMSIKQTADMLTRCVRRGEPTNNNSNPEANKNAAIKKLLLNAGVQNTNFVNNSPMGVLESALVRKRLEAVRGDNPSNPNYSKLRNKVSALVTKQGYTVEQLKNIVLGKSKNGNGDLRNKLASLEAEIASLRGQKGKERKVTRLRQNKQELLNRVANLEKSQRNALAVGTQEVQRLRTNVASLQAGLKGTKKGTQSSKKLRKQLESAKLQLTNALTRKNEEHRLALEAKNEELKAEQTKAAQLNSLVRKALVNSGENSPAVARLRTELELAKTSIAETVAERNAIIANKNATERSARNKNSRLQASALQVAKLNRGKRYVLNSFRKQLNAEKARASNLSAKLNAEIAQKGEHTRAAENFRTKLAEANANKTRIQAEFENAKRRQAYNSVAKNAAHNAVVARLRKLETNLANAEQKVKKAEANKSTSEQEKNNLLVIAQRKANELQQQLNTAVASKTVSNEAKANAEKALKNHKAASTIQEAFRKYKSEEELSNLRKKLSLANAGSQNATNLRRQIEQAKQNLASKNARGKELEKQIQLAIEEGKKIKNELTNAHGKEKQKLENQLKNAIANAENARQEQIKQQANVGATKAEKEAVKRNLATHKEDLEKLKSVLRERNNTSALKNASFAAKNSELQAERKRVEKLTANLKKATGENANAIRAELALARNSVRQTTAERNALKGNLATKQSERNAALANVERLKGSNARRRAEVLKNITRYATTARTPDFRNMWTVLQRAREYNNDNFKNVTGAVQERLAQELHRIVSTKTLSHMVPQLLRNTEPNLREMVRQKILELNLGKARVTMKPENQAYIGLLARHRNKLQNQNYEGYILAISGDSKKAGAKPAFGGGGSAPSKTTDTKMVVPLQARPISSRPVSPMRKTQWRSDTVPRSQPRSRPVTPGPQLSKEQNRNRTREKPSNLPTSYAIGIPVQVARGLSRGGMKSDVSEEFEEWINDTYGKVKGLTAKNILRLKRIPVKNGLDTAKKSANKTVTTIILQAMERANRENREKRQQLSTRSETSAMSVASSLGKQEPQRRRKAGLPPPGS
jgi:hypothetical protein